jgi:hypothetical protein
LIEVLAAAQPLGAELETLRRAEERREMGINDPLPEAVAAVKAWHIGGVGAAGLHNGLLRAYARLPLPRLREFFAALTGYAEADEAHFSGTSGALRCVGVTYFNDPVDALWTALRATAAVVLVSSFWILSNWPHGSTAVILAAVATARLATMGRAVPISIAAALIFSLTTIPAFVIVEVLLPGASGFEMFALIIAPVIFCCALLMAHKKTQLIGFFSGLLFASVGMFQNRMVYDPIGLLNTSIAAVFAAGTASVLWSVLAPETSEAARRRFLRIARQAMARLTAPRLRIGLAEFETAMTEALGQWQNHLRPDRPDDVVAFEEGIALLGVGRALISSREGNGAETVIARPNFGLAAKHGADLWGPAPACPFPNITKECTAMLREVGLFGALAPSLLLYFLAAIPLFLVIDRLASPLGFYRLVWHPPLVRLALFACVFSGIVLLTAS